MKFDRFHQKKYYVLCIVILSVAIVVNLISMMNTEGQELANHIFHMLFQFALICYFLIEILKPYLEKSEEKSLPDTMLGENNQEEM